MGSNSAEDYQTFLARFRREADIVATLEHINIMPLYAYGEEDQFAYIIMPYMSGGSLSDAISKQGRLSLQQTYTYLQQAASALDYAHARNIVHRDLKPSNFLLSPEDKRLVLADFGIARIAATNPYATQETTLTQAGTIPGTLAYMAPEMLRDSKNIDYRVDIYALGIVLYQMLSGEPPFAGDFFVLINKHLSEPLPLLHQRDQTIPASIDSVLSKATAKDREERYSSVGELLKDFRIAISSASMGSSAGLHIWNSPTAPVAGMAGKESPMRPPSSGSGSYSDARDARGEMLGVIYPAPVQDEVTGMSKGDVYSPLTTRSAINRANENTYPSQQARAGSADPAFPNMSTPAYQPTQAASADRDNMMQAFPPGQNSGMQAMSPSGLQPARPVRRPLRGGIIFLIILLFAGTLVGFGALIKYHSTPPAPPPAPTTSLTPATEAAKQVLREYYTDVNERNYAAAYNRLTPQFQRYLGYNSFVSGYANTKHDDISFDRAREVSTSNVYVVTTIRALETKPQGDVINTYHIAYTIVYIDASNGQRGAWKIQGGVSA
jgi:serine/threonine-protein kinase